MNKMAIGFVGVLAVVGLGVDYQQQSLRAGVPMGQFGLAAYTDSITTRFHGMKDEKARAAAEALRISNWNAGGKAYLPEAPEGWARQGFDEGEITAIVPAHVSKHGAKEHQGANLLANARDLPQGKVLAFGVARPEEVRESVAGRSWIYRRGDETVYVEIVLAKPQSLRKMAQASNASLAGLPGGREDGFAVIAGVPFVEARNADGALANHYRILTATLGMDDRILIRVHANASKESTREILGAIDYDALNALLPEPLETVGRDAVLAPGVSEEQAAQDMQDMRRKLSVLRQAEVRFRLKYLHGEPLLLQNPDGTGDATVDVDELILGGYRLGLADVMKGGKAAAVVDGLSLMLVAALANPPSKDKAAPVQAQLSPALAAELGVMRKAAPEGQMAAMQKAGAPAGEAGAPAKGGGFLSSIKSLFGGGGGGGEAGKSASAAATRENATVRKMGGESTRLVQGGCGAGQFCQAKN